MKSFIKQRLREQMIDGQEMNHDEQTFCNTMSVPPSWLDTNSYVQVVKFLHKMLGPETDSNAHIWQKIQAPLKNWASEEGLIDNEVVTKHMSGDSMPDEGNTYWVELQTAICEQGSDFQ